MCVCVYERKSERVSESVRLYMYVYTYIYISPRLRESGKAVICVCVCVCACERERERERERVRLYVYSIYVYVHLCISPHLHICCTHKGTPYSSPQHTRKGIIYISPQPGQYVEHVNIVATFTHRLNSESSEAFTCVCVNVSVYE